MQDKLFSCKVKVGLTTSLPQDVLQTIQSEEKLEKVIDSIKTPEQHGADDPKQEEEVPFLLSTDWITTQSQESKNSGDQTLDSQQPSTSELIACCVCLLVSIHVETVAENFIRSVDMLS